jgi:hypothetical protein
MWALLRDWLLLNTVLNGPEDTRRKVRAAGAVAGHAAGRTPRLLADLAHLALWLAWLGLMLLCLVVAAAGVGRRDAATVLGSLLVAGFLVIVLVTVRAAWGWFRRQWHAADAATARARARRAGVWYE